MKRSLVSLSCLLVFLTLIPALSSAQDRPAAGVELQLVDENGKVVGTTTTKSNGSWSFNAPSDGSYSLVIPGGLEAAGVAINKKGTGADKGKSANKPLTATATYSDGKTEKRKEVSGLESEIEVIEFKLELTSDDVSIVSPRDAASGQASGKRTHNPVKIVKQMDKSTPLLFKSAGGSGGSIKGTMTYDLKSATK